MLREFLVIGDIGIGLDDVGEGGAGRFQTGLDVLPTCWIWARMSPLPTQLPCASRASWPATKICRPAAADGDHMGIGRVAGPHHDMLALRFRSSRSLIAILSPLPLKRCYPDRKW